MANIKSAQKRIETTKRDTLRNKSKKSEIKTYIKKFDEAIEAGNVDEAREIFRHVDKKMKQAEAKNIIHKNKVARTTSRLQRAINNAQNA
ncbi:MULTISPECIES: 30S ribosomal protein S20 [Anaerococcus]|uniref:Small ribosomal subunit protein bS20 n=1 Tax=Anaerococcus nagyae TaxID=1755241 RepID=A0A3E2TJY5_9FIRM|nr:MULTISPECIES: 30S ribosomal protein S20 [Anaerococcus]MBP2069433.1 small subunit ribosomal protein S20 [Anaerococcus nagyae]MDU1829102.1 30S ribosomal protein S20 [Anaerococcus sp.]MDU1864296.1 30S ribosomal protein S20 [Anaerococcus sp.]MDU2353482.1 30S ribosomal protein S20 [Anaerococcus sp.]MDU2565795.1 30S ribosomal protein S20 [Anaerococcus sp.]